MLLSAITLAAALFAYFLLIKRRIIGLALIALLLIIVLLSAVLLLPDVLSFYLYAAVCQIAIFGLPWLLVFWDKRRSGVVLR